MPTPAAALASEIQDRVASAKLISLFLDFDGTLVPIASMPGTPQLDSDTCGTLQLLAGRRGMITTVISGRAIEDLYARIHLEHLIYAGNHGLEIFGKRLSFVEPVAAERRDALQRLCEELTEELRPVPGAFVESKGLTASVHYRLVDESRHDTVRKIVLAHVSRRGELFRVNEGRKVLDIVPHTNWHKGAAVEWINSRLTSAGTLTIYLGDDVTDEDAFRVLPEAITIKVGPANDTVAKYRLPDPAAVREFLAWLAEAKPSI